MPGLPQPELSVAAEERAKPRRVGSTAWSGLRRPPVAAWCTPPQFPLGHYTKAHLETRLELTVAYYATLRPHQGLDGATPAEVFLGKETAATRAVRPPRIGERDPTDRDPLPLEVVFLDTERRLPVIVPTQRAA